MVYGFSLNRGAGGTAKSGVILHKTRTKNSCCFWSICSCNILLIQPSWLKNSRIFVNKNKLFNLKNQTFAFSKKNHPCKFYEQNLFICSTVVRQWKTLKGTVPCFKYYVSCKHSSHCDPPLKVINLQFYIIIIKHWVSSTHVFTNILVV